MVPKKSGHGFYGAILFPRLLVHSRQNYGILCLGMQQRSEKGFHMHKSLQLYIERTFCKTQSVHLGGNRRNNRFFVRLVALIFRLTVGTFACLAAVGFLANC